jgi:hypothetical protein
MSGDAPLRAPPTPDPTRFLGRVLGRAPGRTPGWAHTTLAGTPRATKLGTTAAPPALPGLPHPLTDRYRMGYLRYLRTLSYIRTVHIVGDRLGDPQSVFSLDSPRQVCLFLYPILFPIYLWIPLARTLEHIGP